MDLDDQPGNNPLRTDPLLAVAALTLGALGVVNLVGLDERESAGRQAFLVVTGLAALWWMARRRGADRRMVGRTLYAVAVAMLLVVTLLASHRAFGAARWLGTGSVMLQPSELAKIGVLLLVAEILAAPERRHRLLTALLAAAVPVGLTVVQPDLSTALLLSIVAGGLLLLGRVRLRHIAMLAAGIAVVVPFAAQLLRPYQVQRLHVFLSGGADAQGAGWSILQAHVAIASGGLTGASQLPHPLLATYLPARESDLAFASLVEQHGLVAGTLVLGASAVLVWRLVRCAMRARTGAGSLVAAGLALLTGVEVLVNVGGNLGVLPLAGVPCPFLSGGGTAAVAHLLAIGVVLGDVHEARVRRLWRPPRSRRRPPRLARSVAALSAAALTMLGMTVSDLQGVQGERLRAIALDQATRDIVVYAPRGRITDRHGAVIAEDTGDVRVRAVVRTVLGTPGAVVRLAAALHTTPAQVRTLLAGPVDGWTVDVAVVPAQMGASIAALHLPGVLLDASGHRRYPTGPLVAPAVGFAGVGTADDVARIGPVPPREVVGRAGLEQTYDAVLRGHDGVHSILVDAQGRVAGTAGDVAAVAGGDVVTSIDLGLQQEATSELARALRGVPGQPRGDQGAVVVMDAQTGELLALASLPAYDDNVFGPPVDVAALRRLASAPAGAFLERAAQEAAPPGSTFKLVVAAADAVHRAIPPNQVIPTGAALRFGNAVFHNWTALPPQNLTEAIAWSNDVYFYKLALALGPQRVAQVARMLGVGERTGLDIPGESAGVLATPGDGTVLGRAWQPGLSLLLGIGQGAVVATPLQDARWTAAVSTGHVVTPHLGMATRAPATATVRALPPSAAKPLPFAAALGPVREGMRRAVTEGTASLLRSLPVPAGGKTGTAEDPSTPGGADAWFTAVAPMAHPDVVATVFVRGGGEGFFTAEPAAARILAYYLAHRDAIRATVPLAAPLPPPPPSRSASVGTAMDVDAAGEPPVDGGAAGSRVRRGRRG